MKKFLIVICCLLMSNFANAQMTDTMGSLAIDGVLTDESFNSVNQMNAALKRMHLQQDIAVLVAEVQTTFMGSYKNVDKNLLGFYGLKGIEWDIKPVSDFEFYVELQKISKADCILCQNNAWSAKRVEINDGGECKAQNNTVRIYFE